MENKICILIRRPVPIPGKEREPNEALRHEEKDPDPTDRFHDYPGDRVLVQLLDSLTSLQQNHQLLLEVHRDELVHEGEEVSGVEPVPECEKEQG